jgi:hypothetical protein
MVAEGLRVGFLCDYSIWRLESYVISLITILYQVAATALIAIFLVWSTYRDNKYASPNDKWLRALKRLPDKLNVGIRAFVVFGAMFVIADVFWISEPYIHKLFFYLLDALGVQGTQVGVGALVIVCGAGAYWFKAKNQLSYGIVEVIFAGAAGVVTARELSTATQLAGPIATLIGAVYVVSRGISNIMDATAKRNAQV